MQFIELMNKDYFSITCARVHLVPISKLDLDSYFQAYDDEVAAYQMNDVFKSKKELCEYFENCQQLRENGLSLVCSIKDENEEFLGSVEIHAIDTATPQIGIWLKKPALKKEIGVEALLGAINFLNMVLDAKYYIYAVDERDEIGIALAERLNGECVDHKSVKNKNGKQLDLKIYHIQHKDGIKKVPSFIAIKNIL